MRMRYIIEEVKTNENSEINSLRNFLRFHSIYHQTLTH